MFQEGIKTAKAERGTLRSLAPILFIPHGDGNQDLQSVCNIKVHISDEVVENV